MAYGERVKNRTELAGKLKGTARAKSAGIKDADLDVVITAGTEAKEADLDQKNQMADNQTELVERADRTDEILERGEQLKNRLPAVIDTLMELGHKTLATFLIALTFTRYRTRKLPPIDPELAETEEIKSVRVEREDKPALIEALANFTKSLLRPERSLIVDELASRGMDRAVLEQLHADAEEQNLLGKNKRKAAEATAREGAAVARQKKKWDANYLMIRAAVQGDSELEKLFAKC